MLMISQSLKERLDGKPFPLPAGVTLFKILVISSALIFRPCNVKACSLFLICFCNNYWREWEVKRLTPKASCYVYMSEKDLWYPGQHACIHVFRKIILTIVCCFGVIVPGPTHFWDVALVMYRWLKSPRIFPCSLQIKTKSRSC